LKKGHVLDLGDHLTSAVRLAERDGVRSHALLQKLRTQILVRKIWGKIRGKSRKRKYEKERETKKTRPRSHSRFPTSAKEELGGTEGTKVISRRVKRNVGQSS